MSNVKFLFNKTTKELNQFFLRDSKQQWQDLIQRILNNQLDLSQTEYMIVEDERIDRISHPTMFYLPKKGITNSRMTSIIQYTKFESQFANLLMIPWLNRGVRSVGQKRVTIIPTNRRSTIDENYPTDDIRQLMTKTFSKYSSLIRKNDSNSIVDNQQTQSLSRLSILSISYGTKTWKNIRGETEEKTISPIASISSLPANKIELDLDQQENLRRMSTVKKLI